MNKINFTLMGKGGVGKSMVSWLLAQYFRSLGNNVYCADTDPTNATFYHFSALDVDYIEIMRRWLVALLRMRRYVALSCFAQL